LFRGVVENAGRDVLINLEQELLAREVGRAAGRTQDLS
jgi:hypothetical protein